MIKKREGLKLSYSILVAVVVLLNSSGCSTLFLSWKNAEIKERIALAEELSKQGKYEQAIKENESILKKYSENPWLDKVLYNQGCLLILSDNPHRNISRAKSYFERIDQEFPKSKHRREARVWSALLSELQLKLNAISQMEIEHLEKKEEIHRLKKELDSVRSENSAILVTLSKEILQKEQAIAEMEKEMLAQKTAINNLKDQIKKIKNIDIEVEKKKKVVKE